MHRAIYNILLPLTGWHLIPFPPPQRVYGCTLRHNQIFADGWFTKFSYPWCSAGALRAPELRYKVYFDPISPSWAFVTSLNCSVMCQPPWWFECYFLRSSWIHWLLLAVLSDYFGQLVTSAFLLCKFWGLPAGLPLLVSPLWGVESVLEWRDCLSQVAQVPGNGLRYLPERKPTWSE